MTEFLCTRLLLDLSIYLEGSFSLHLRYLANRRCPDPDMFTVNSVFLAIMGINGAV